MRQIDQLFLEVQAAWNEGDVGAYARLFAPDAAYVSRSGSLWIGRKEIERQHLLAFDKGLRGSRLRLQVRHIHPFSADTALVHAQVRLAPPPSRDNSTKALTTFLLQFKSGRWRIAAAHTSELVSSALRTGRK